jgi:hypothetical protein
MATIAERLRGAAAQEDAGPGACHMLVYEAREAADTIDRLEAALKLSNANCDRMSSLAIDNARDMLALRAEIDRLTEALTPSADTKAAYMGEFYWEEVYMDDDGHDVVRKIPVPWTVIKQIMAAIRTRGAQQKDATNG